MVKSGTVLVEQWHSNGGTVWWNNETVIVEQCGGKWNSVGGTVEQGWWNSETVMVEQCGRTVEQCCWNIGTVMVEQWNIGGRRMEQ